MFIKGNMFFKKAPLNSCCGMPLRMAALMFAFIQLVIALSLLAILSPLLCFNAREISKRLEDDLSEMANREGITISHNDMTEISIDAGNQIRNILKMHTGQQTLQAVLEIMYFILITVFFLFVTVLFLMYGLYTRQTRFIVPWMYTTLVIVIIIPTVVTICFMVTRYPQNSLAFWYIIPLAIHGISVFTWLVVYSYYVKLKSSLSSYNTYHKTEVAPIISHYDSSLITTGGTITKIQVGKAGRKLTNIDMIDI